MRNRAAPCVNQTFQTPVATFGTPQAGEYQHPRKPAVALQHEDGSWRVHTDPKGDPKMAAHFAKALTRLRETVCVWRGHDFVWGEPFNGSLTVKDKTYRTQQGQCSRCGVPTERSVADCG